MMSTELRTTGECQSELAQRHKGMKETRQKSVGRDMQSYWCVFKPSITIFLLNYLFFSVSFVPRPCFPGPFCSSPVYGRSTAVESLMKRGGWTTGLQLYHHLSVLAKKKNPNKDQKTQTKDSLCAAQEALSNECVCDLITHLPKMTLLLIFTEKKKAEQHTRHCYCNNKQPNYQVFIFQCTQLLGENENYSLTLCQSRRKPCASLPPVVLTRNTSQILINRE